MCLAAEKAAPLLLVMLAYRVKDGLAICWSFHKGSAICIVGVRL